MRVFSTALAFLITAACIFGLWDIANDYDTSIKTARFDAQVSSYLKSQRSPWLDAIMKFITYSGGIIGVTVLTTVLFFWLYKVGRVDDANFTAVLVIIGTILAGIMKRYLGRIRPAAEGALINLPMSTSFPSGHSMASLCLALAAIEALMVSPTVSIPLKLLGTLGCLLYAFLVGVSRVYLGVHYPSDVIAAWLLGGAWIAFATGLNKIFYIGRIELPPLKFRK